MGKALPAVDIESEREKICTPFWQLINLHTNLPSEIEQFIEEAR